jgi:hypothetical protein
MTPANPDELKQLIDDAAKLLGIKIEWEHGKYARVIGEKCYFEPQNPERGDLMKVADAAELMLDYRNCAVSVFIASDRDFWDYTKGDYQSLVLAVLRAASATWKARGTEGNIFATMNYKDLVCGGEKK